MFTRYLLLMYLFALFAVSVHANEDVIEPLDVDMQDVVERDSPMVSAIVEVLSTMFKNIAQKCLVEAAVHCKSLWLHPSDALQCGKNYFEEHKKHCAI